SDSVLSPYLVCTPPQALYFLFSFTHPSTTELYTLSLHDALPICRARAGRRVRARRSSGCPRARRRGLGAGPGQTSSSTWTTGRSDRKSTRLNSSHVSISYAVFCLKKKNTK